MIHNLTQALTLQSGQKTPLINSQSVGFNFNSSNSTVLTNDLNELVGPILTSYFKKFSVLISKPVFILTPGKLTIHLIYYKKEVSISPDKLKKTRGYLHSRLINSYNNQFKLVFINRLKFHSHKLIKENKKINNKNISNTKKIKEITRLTTFQRNKLLSIYLKSHRSALRSMRRLANKNSRFLSNSPIRFGYVSKILANLLNIEVELQLVHLKYPYHDSNILASIVGINGKKLTYGRIKKILFGKATIFTKQTTVKKSESIVADICKNSVEINKQLVTKDFKSVDMISINENSDTDKKVSAITEGNGTKKLATRLTGIKIRISGRLARQRVVPKRTVKTAYKGGISKSNNNLVDSSTYVSKNKKGAFAIRV